MNNDVEMVIHQLSSIDHKGYIFNLWIIFYLYKEELPINYSDNAKCLRGEKKAARAFMLTARKSKKSDDGMNDEGSPYTTHDAQSNINFLVLLETSSQIK